MMSEKKKEEQLEENGGTQTKAFGDDSKVEQGHPRR